MPATDSGGGEGTGDKGGQSSKGGAGGAGGSISGGKGGSSGGSGSSSVGGAAGARSGGAGGASSSGTSRGGAAGSGTRGGAGGRGGTSGSSSGGVTGSGGVTSAGGAAGSPRGGAGGTSQGGSGGSSPDAGGGQSGGDASGGSIAITGLKITANPKNVLSAFVSWTTDKPSDSVVQFGQGKYEWEISDPAPVTSHKVLIIGMRASKPYQIKAISSADGSSGSATGNFTTGALPAQIPVVSVPINDTTKTQPGWTLMNILKSSSTMGPISDYPAAAAMYDATGQPVWYCTHGTTKDFGGAISTQLTDKGVLMGPVVSSAGPGEPPREVDFACDTVWECKDPLCGGTGGITHEAVKLPNGNYVNLRWKSIGASSDSDTTFEEIDPSGKVVWSLNFTKLVPRPAGATGDWCHGNSITIDFDKDEVIANCRFMGAIKTTYKNPNSLVWYLPASYGKATGNLSFSPPSAQYNDTHHPQMYGDDLLVFDNGGYATSGFPGGGGTTYHSRVLEFKIDEAAKTANLTWEYPGNFTVDAWYKNNWYATYYGDADRLANGNVLITSGAVGSNAGDARIFEVLKADGKVVWEFRLPAGYGVYRSERITPPLVKAISQ